MIVKIMYQNGLHDILPVLYKVTSILATMSATLCSAERTFSAYSIACENSCPSSLPAGASHISRDRFVSAVWSFLQQIRCPSCDTPLGPGVKKDGCFCRLPSLLQDIFKIHNGIYNRTRLTYM